MSDELSPLAYRYQKALAPLVRLSDDASLGKRLSELLTLLDFNTTLNRSLKLNEIVDLVLFVAMGETRARWASVALSGEDGLLRSVARRGGRAPEPPEPDGTSFPPGDLENLEHAVGPGDAKLSPLTKELLASMGADLMVPLRKAGKLIGVLLLGERPGEYGPGERSFAEALAISAAASIDNGRVYEEMQLLNRRLTLKIYQLNSLFDITRELHRALDATRVREVLVAGAMGQPLATRCVLVQPGGAVELRGVKADPAQLEMLRSEDIKLDVKEEGTAVKDLEGGPLKEMLDSWGLEVALPLRAGSSSHGVLLVGHKASGEPIGAEDSDLLRSLAAQGAAALDNLRLTREWVEKQKIEKELAVAREIQRGLLPERDPSLPGWDIAGVNIPCLTVGGDYYDYVESADGKLGLTIADVSGKGTGPALLMASVQASLGALSGIGTLPIEVMLSRLNAMVFRSTGPSKYVTVFFGWLDPGSGELSYVNAGHCYPLLFRRGGEVVRLAEGSAVIGLLPELQVEVGRTRLESEEMLVLYTDGLSETRSPAGEEFEEERIVETTRAAAGESARDVVAKLVATARVFAAEAGLNDDLTLMVVKRL